MMKRGLGLQSRENLDPNGVEVPGYAGRYTQIGGPMSWEEGYDDPEWKSPKKDFHRAAYHDIRKRVFDARRDRHLGTSDLGRIYDEFERDWLARASEFGLSEEEAQEQLDVVIEGDWDS